MARKRERQQAEAEAENSKAHGNGKGDVKCASRRTGSERHGATAKKGEWTWVRSSRRNGSVQGAPDQSGGAAASGKQLETPKGSVENGKYMGPHQLTGGGVGAGQVNSAAGMGAGCAEIRRQTTRTG